MRPITSRLIASISTVGAGGGAAGGAAAGGGAAAAASSRRKSNGAGRRPNDSDGRDAAPDPLAAVLTSSGAAVRRWAGAPCRAVPVPREPRCGVAAASRATDGGPDDDCGMSGLAAALESPGRGIDARREGAGSRVGFHPPALRLAACPRRVCVAATEASVEARCRSRGDTAVRSGRRRAVVRPCVCTPAGAVAAFPVIGSAGARRRTVKAPASRLAWADTVGCAGAPEECRWLWLATNCCDKAIAS